MGSITNLQVFKKKKPKLKLEIPTLEQAFALASEGLFDQWTFHSENYTLNQFITEKIQEEKDWLNDRNAVADLEEGLNFEFSVMSPGFTDENLLGWKARFVWSGDMMFDTPVLTSETRARLYCVLLYLALADAASEVKSHEL